MHPLGLPLLVRDIFRASSANSTVVLGPMAPTHNLPQPYVYLERQVQPALPELDIDNVSEPRPVGLSASNLRLPRSSAESFLDARFLPERRLTHEPPLPALAHDSRRALARGAHARPPQLEEHIRCAVYVATFCSGLGYHRRKLLVAHRVSARRAPLPCVVAPAGHVERGAQLRHRPDILVGEDVLELRLIRRLAYGCLLAKKALILKYLAHPLQALQGQHPHRKAPSPPRGARGRRQAGAQSQRRCGAQAHLLGLGDRVQVRGPFAD